MSGHTPAPWLIRKGDERTNSIVTLTGHDSLGEPMYWEVASFNLRRDEAIANGKLIAAAPDLLSALREADRLYSTNALVAVKIGCGAWINTVRDAIAKAGGES